MGLRLVGSRMLRKTDKNLLVSLDIGSAKVVVVVAEVLVNGSLELIGIGSCPSHGIKKGIVVDIDAVVGSVKKAIEEAELMSGCQIYSVYTGISGNHISSINSRGVVAIQQREVAQIDLHRVIESARAVPIPANKKVLHIIPQEFIIDNQSGIKEPLGMSGIRLEANIHMITSSISCAQNIVSCVRRCGIEVDDIVLAQLASSYAVLTDDEKQLGVCVVDIGGGTTDVSIYTEGAIRHTLSLPVAGSQVTNDLAVALRCSSEVAEGVKLKHGCTLQDLADEKQEISIEQLGKESSELSESDLVAVIEPRYEEILSLVNSELEELNLKSSLNSGVVLTGGAAQIKGIVNLAEKVFSLPVRLGIPGNVSGLTDRVQDPAFATAIGLLLHGANKQTDKPDRYHTGVRVKDLLGRLKSWFQGNF